VDDSREEDGVVGICSVWPIRGLSAKKEEVSIETTRLCIDDDNVDTLSVVLVSAVDVAAVDDVEVDVDVVDDCPIDVAAVSGVVIVGAAVDVSASVCSAAISCFQ
jgi:hypothetical protein